MTELPDWTGVGGIIVSAQIDGSWNGEVFQLAKGVRG